MFRRAWRSQESWIGASSVHSVISLHRASLLLFEKYGNSSLVRGESSVLCIAKGEYGASGTDLNPFHAVTT